jgi:hypothetical protein
MTEEHPHPNDKLIERLLLAIAQHTAVYNYGHLFGGKKFEQDMEHNHFGVVTALSEAMAHLSSVIVPDPRCDITRNGDQFLCLKHKRYWVTGICPGIR